MLAEMLPGIHEACKSSRNNRKSTHSGLSADTFVEVIITALGKVIYHSQVLYGY